MKIPSMLATLLLPLLSADLEASEAINAAFDIRNLGAVGDGRTLNTAARQWTIDACTAPDGGEVVIAGGKFVTGTIYLKDNVTLHLAAGTALLVSTNIADYATDTHRNKYAGESHLDRCLIFARWAKNIGIVGSGAIDGRGGKLLVKLNKAAMVLAGVAGDLERLQHHTCFFTHPYLDEPSFNTLSISTAS